MRKTQILKDLEQTRKELKKFLRELKYLEKKGQQFVLNKVRRKRLFPLAVQLLHIFLEATNKIKDWKNKDTDTLIDEMFYVDRTIYEMLTLLQTSLFAYDDVELPLVYQDIEIFQLKIEKLLWLADYIEEKYLTQKAPEATS